MLNTGLSSENTQQSKGLLREEIYSSFLALSLLSCLTGRLFLVINALETTINCQDKSITEHTDYTLFYIVTCLNKTYKN